MPASSGADDGEFDVSASAQVLRSISRLQRQATAEGRGSEFLSALQTLHDRMRRNPRELGEPLKEMPASNMQLRVAAWSPVRVEFAVHKTKFLVFVRAVTLFESAD